jgi:hypothetical protein
MANQKRDSKQMAGLFSPFDTLLHLRNIIVRNLVMCLAQTRKHFSAENIYLKYSI